MLAVEQKCENEEGCDIAKVRRMHPGRICCVAETRPLHVVAQRISDSGYPSCIPSGVGQILCVGIPDGGAKGDDVAHARRERTCAICGTASQHEVRMSTSYIGSTDLDTRPPEVDLGGV